MDLIIILLVKFDLGGFLISIKITIVDQNIAKTNHPVINA